MAFQPGHKHSKGRVPGAVNKRTAEAYETLRANNFDPIKALMDGHQIAMARFVEELDLVASNRLSPMESSAPQYLKMAIDCAKDLASYAFPKLKAIEQIKADPLSEMTPQQKLEAMRMAVAHLEAQVKKDGDGPSAL